MPRLNQNFLEAVFFVYGTDPQTGIYGPRGSGVLVGYTHAFGIGTYRHIYAVTCHHVVLGGGHDVRINTKDGKTRTIEIELDEWQFIRFGPDIAAVDVTDRLLVEGQKAVVCAPDMFMTREFIDEVEVGVGEDGFMLGLFADHPGKQRNLVAARFGNLSLLADETEPLKHPNKNNHPAHLFDMRSRPGFSGSPVYIYRTPSGDLRRATERGRSDIGRSQAVNRAIKEAERYGRSSNLGPAVAAALNTYEVRGNTFMMLLGIHAGQYHDRVVVRKAPTVSAEVNLVEGDRLSVPNSIALVVPAWEIPVLLALETFQKQRDAREEDDKRKYEEQNAAMPEGTEGP